MPRAPCKRDHLTGLKWSIDVSAAVAEARALGCNVFSVNSIGYLMGCGTKSRQAVAYIDQVVIPRAICASAHFVELIDDEGGHRGWATAVNSAEKAGELHDARVAGIHRGESAAFPVKWR